MYRNRLVKFNQEDAIYTCTQCSYGTSRKANFERHIQSSRHKVLNREGLDETTEHDTNSDSPSEYYLVHGVAESPILNHDHDDHELLTELEDIFTSESDEHIITAESEEEEEEPDIPNSNLSKTADLGSEWFPFESKIHWLK